MIFEILDDKGNVLNTIIAEPSFVEEKYKGQFRMVEEIEVAISIPPVDPLIDIKAQLDKIIADITVIKNQTKT